MKNDRNLKEILRRIDGKGYKAYKEIQGGYRFPRYLLWIDHVQGDPFAAPSRIRVRIDRKTSGFPSNATSEKIRTIATCDYLIRTFHQNCHKYAKGNRGTGKSGVITIDAPVQQVLERSAMVLNSEFVEARFFMGLPGHGRGISGPDAEAMFFEELPCIVNDSLFMKHLSKQAFYHHIETVEDTDFLRKALQNHHLIGFVGDNALLPRASGIDPRPLANGQAVRFKAPEGLRTTVYLPNRGPVTGMGIAKGVTLIVGGGYHGKSTLLNALEMGIYNHIPGDGRELVVTLPNAVKIRAADGRNVEQTDISPFINNLPYGKDTKAFSTQNASGSTSQAANIIEAVEVGAGVLLLDEDTSATNFMIRDIRMQQLVAKDQEPITPFIDKVAQLYRDKGVSTILVMGGSGDYFNVADHVIRMSDYQPLDVTALARKIAAAGKERRRPEGGTHFGKTRDRCPLALSFDPFRINRRQKITATRLREILFGETVVDMWDVEQLVDISQTRAIGYAIQYATRFMNGNRTMKEILALLIEELEKNGLDMLPPYTTGDLARFREIELAAAINRMRTLKIRQIN
ncbi:MAG: ABC-ATPase domain-containing protein [Desulfobacterales bacterium]|nr:ABC-ATPase domain-containing protein [Desulfobacterales bacterium]